MLVSIRRTGSDRHAVLSRSSAREAGLVPSTLRKARGQHIIRASSIAIEPRMADSRGGHMLQTSSFCRWVRTDGQRLMQRRRACFDSPSSQPSTPAQMKTHDSLPISPALAHDTAGRHQRETKGALKTRLHTSGPGGVAASVAAGAASGFVGVSEASAGARGCENSFVGSEGG